MRLVLLAALLLPLTTPALADGPGPVIGTDLAAETCAAIDSAGEIASTGPCGDVCGAAPLFVPATDAQRAAVSAGGGICAGAAERMMQQQLQGQQNSFKPLPPPATKV